uniref:Potassium channel domain-containing protein n=1 Tax=Romanomermis culicivorax TaxID=13658 RepID=A0A915JFZ6_ROMCU
MMDLQLPRSILERKSSKIELNCSTSKKYLQILELILTMRYSKPNSKTDSVTFHVCAASHGIHCYLKLTVINVECSFYEEAHTDEEFTHSIVLRNVATERFAASPLICIMLQQQQGASYLSDNRRASSQGAVSETESKLQSRTFLKRLKIGIKNFYKKLGLGHLACIALLVFYTVIGGLIFYAVEYEYDSQAIRRRYLTYTEEKERILRLLYKVAKNCTTKRFEGQPRWPVDETTCFRTISNSLDDYENKLDIRIPNSTKWDFWYSVYFACTIYTTIGYGDIYCSSVPGRLMTMFYALIGIPILLTTLNDLGKSMFKLLLLLVSNINKLQNRFTKNDSKKVAAPRLTGGSLKKISISTPIAGFQIENADQQHQNVEFNLKTCSLEVPLERNYSGAEDLDLETAPHTDVKKVDDTEDEAADEQREYRHELPVWLALSVTVGWIFGCAALFCIWETRWDYFQSIYFFFISLTTIGLGDVTPDHPKYMIIAYGLVIIGLALVSMCINVIQQKIERLYYQLLEKLLTDYQANLSTGQNQLRATMGMMRMWNASPRAKYLVPLLSKNAKQTVAHKFHDEKEAQGINVPPALKQLNPTSGLPVALALAAERKQDEIPKKYLYRWAKLIKFCKAYLKRIAKILRPIRTFTSLTHLAEILTFCHGMTKRRNPPADADGGYGLNGSRSRLVTDLEAMIMEKLQQVELEHQKALQKTQSMFGRASSFLDLTQSRKVSQGQVYDGVTQTDHISFDDKIEQTIVETLIEQSIQTDRSDLNNQNVIDEAQQTLLIEVDQKDSQTSIHEFRNQESQSELMQMEDIANQTTKITLLDQELQTHVFIVEDRECQGDIFSTTSTGMQTSGLALHTPEIMVDEDQQTDEAEDVELADTSKKEHGFAATAKRRLRRVLGGRHGQKKPRPPSKEESTEESSGEPSSSQPVLTDLVDIERAFNRKDSHRGSISKL